MKKALIAASILVLAACSQEVADTAKTAEETAPTPSEEAGFEAVAPGDYNVIRADGSVDQLTIHPGLTWTMVFSDGNAAGGTIFAQGGQNCFVTEGVEGHQCFTEGPRAEDGSMEVTAEDGEVMSVVPTQFDPE